MKNNHSFKNDIPYDNDLANLLKDFPSHSFLNNPTGQNVYNYLIYYLLDFSEQYFKKSRKDLKILDWGCGKGHVSYLLKKANASVMSCDVLIDSSDSSFGQQIPIIEKSGISVDPLEPGFILPYEDNSFDVVLSFGVLEHVPDDLNSLKEINRILKPNGLIFVFNLPYIYSWTQKIARMRGNFYHDRLYSKSLVKILTNESGFEIVDIWFRQLFPKNNIKYPNYRLFEHIDQFLTEHSVFKYFATSLEFVAKKRKIIEK